MYEMSDADWKKIEKILPPQSLNTQISKNQKRHAIQSFLLAQRYAGDSSDKKMKSLLPLKYLASLEEKQVLSKIHNLLSKDSSYTSNKDFLIKNDDTDFPVDQSLYVMMIASWLMSQDVLRGKSKKVRYDSLSSSVAEKKKNNSNSLDSSSNLPSFTTVSVIIWILGVGLAFAFLLR